MKIQYRYVDYGTVFAPALGMRQLNDEGEPNRLYENELALDVGGLCWGNRDCETTVIDHHFHNPTQFPSASSAVLHLSQKIRERFSAYLSKFKNLWLISHREPDFDSFCSMYLARNLILTEDEPIDWKRHGLHPSGWTDVEYGDDGILAKKRRINWFAPEIQGLTEDQRWQVLLAALASCIDNGISISCPFHMALHSILYAAIKRGRPYQERDSGAVEFFGLARNILIEQKLNPLMDSVFAGESQFAPEITMLSRECAAYERDLLRARKALINIPTVEPEKFRAFYDRRTTAPLLDMDGQLRLEHRPHLCKFQQVDAVYIRDPESLLFKEWARHDTTNSSLGRGFTFTAVAYSHAKTGAVINDTDYYFAVDPEHIGGAHLYYLWAVLQSAEIAQMKATPYSDLRVQLEHREEQARSAYREAEARAATGDRVFAEQLEKMRPTRCRQHFEQRAANEVGLWDDPWFDGVNYRCSIIAPPNRGSLKGAPGILSDLTDDPVVEVVRAQIETAFYDGFEEISDFPSTRYEGEVIYNRTNHLISKGPIPLLPEGHFRFGKIQVRGGIDLANTALAYQIGCDLWQVLNSGKEVIPDDFGQLHLVKETQLVGIWSHRGIFVAYCAGADDLVRMLQEQFSRMSDLSRELDKALTIAQSMNRSDSRKLVEYAEDLLLRAAGLQHESMASSSVLLRRMFSATGLTEVLATVRDLHSATVERNQRESTTAELSALREAQGKIEWIEVFIVALYATEMVHIVIGMLAQDERWAARIVLIAAAIFGALAYWGLLGSKSKPLLERDRSRPSWALRGIPLSLAILLILMFLVTFLLPHQSSSPPISSPKIGSPEIQSNSNGEAPNKHQNSMDKKK